MVVAIFFRVLHGISECFFLSRGQRRRCVGSAWLNHSCLCFCPPQILVAIVLYIFLLMYASCIRLRRLVEHSTLREFLNSMQRSRLESEILFFTFFSPHANNYFISIPWLWSFRFFMLSFHRCFAIAIIPNHRKQFIPIGYFAIAFSISLFTQNAFSPNF